MDPTLWAKIHGGTTHFPFALAVTSCALDLAASAFPKRQAARSLHSAGFWTVVLASLGSVPAMVSGLVMTNGSILGHGALRMHHLFVWPAFALLVALASWRAIVRERATRTAFAFYLVGMCLTSILICAAGYWGGEMMTAR
jgi:uncharacterized membrane protein